MDLVADPHAGQPVLHAGAPADKARLSMILVHGRGASAESILSLAMEIGLTDIAYVAPQAAGRTWYPLSFLSPIPQNEPGITSGLRTIERLVQSLADRGVPSNRIGLLGFSQGGCLTLEFVARHAQRYAGVFGLSGGLIGPDGTDRNYAGSLEGTPIFLGCSDIDAHIPKARVHETTAVLRRMGASVDERIYPGLGHTVNDDEIEAVRAMLSA